MLLFSTPDTFGGKKNAGNLIQKLFLLFTFIRSRHRIPYNSNLILISPTQLTQFNCVKIAIHFVSVAYESCVYYTKRLYQRHQNSLFFLVLNIYLISFEMIGVVKNANNLQPFFMEILLSISDVFFFFLSNTWNMLLFLKLFINIFWMRGFSTKYSKHAFNEKPSGNRFRNMYEMTYTHTNTCTHTHVAEVILKSVESQWNINVPNYLFNTQKKAIKHTFASLLLYSLYIPRKIKLCTLVWSGRPQECAVGMRWISLIWQKQTSFHLCVLLLHPHLNGRHTKTTGMRK